MKSTKYFKLFLISGLLFLAFSFANVSANNLSNENTSPAKTFTDTSITTDNYIPHIKHPRRHRRWWRRHHHRRRHF